MQYGFGEFDVQIGSVQQFPQRGIRLVDERDLQRVTGSAAPVWIRASAEQDPELFIKIEFHDESDEV